MRLNRLVHNQDLASPSMFVVGLNIAAAIRGKLARALGYELGSSLAWQRTATQYFCRRKISKLPRNARSNSDCKVTDGWLIDSYPCHIASDAGCNRSSLLVIPSSRCPKGAPPLVLPTITCLQSMLIQRIHLRLSMILLAQTLGSSLTLPETVESLTRHLAKFTGPLELFLGSMVRACYRPSGEMNREFLMRLSS